MFPTKFKFSWPFGSEKQEIDFQDDSNGGHLEFRIKRILAIFELQVTLMLPTKFLVSWPFSSGEVKNILSRWVPAWTSYQNDFSFFFVYKLP